MLAITWLEPDVERDYLDKPHLLNRHLDQWGFILTEEIHSVKPANEDRRYFVQVQSDDVGGILGTTLCLDCNKAPAALGQKNRLCKSCTQRYLA